MYTLNKIIGGLTNPFTVAWIGVVVSAVLLVASRIVASRGEVASRTWVVASAKWLMGLSLAWLWVWSTPMMCRVVGNTLECPYLVDGKVPQVEELPEADVIELHGGSMGIATNLAARGEMWYSADRVWMAARLWRAQARKVKVEISPEAKPSLRSKSLEGCEGEEWRPKLLVTGSGSGESTLGLLEDFGVPTNAIIVVNGPRNTEEEAKLVNELVVSGPLLVVSRKPKVLVVTSAWHMTRTLLMYEKYAPNVEAIPAACDFENAVRYSGGFSWQQLLPSDEALVLNRVSLHEWIGIWGYKWFRK